MNSITSTAMKKSEIFDILVNKVCEVCEVREAQVQQGAAGKSQGYHEKAYAFGELNQMSYLCRSKWCEPYV